MFTKLTNMIGKIKYALRGVKLNAHGEYDSEKKMKIGQHLSHLWTNV